MEKKLTWIIVAAVVGLIGVWFYSGYNQLVIAEENVEQAWGQVQNQYQTRADAAAQMVRTVEGAAFHESGTLEAVIEARAKATQMTIDPSKATPEQLKAWQDAQGELNQAMGRLMVVTENYPELKANENFLKLQSDLEKNENACAVARRAFNEHAGVFNKLARVFPRNIIANILGFEKKPYFEADEEAQKAPKVDFSSLNRHKDKAEKSADDAAE